MWVQLAWGFPPRSKWTYREVFHPAVVPQPPFTLHFLKRFLENKLQPSEITFKYCKGF